jgi:hypothetical protein
MSLSFLFSAICGEKRKLARRENKILEKIGDDLPNRQAASKRQRQLAEPSNFL